MMLVVGRDLLAPLRQLQVFTFIFFSGQSVQTSLSLDVKVSLVQSNTTFQNCMKIPWYLAITADEKLQRKTDTLLSGLGARRRIVRLNILRWKNTGKSPLNSSAQITWKSPIVLVDIAISQSSEASCFGNLKPAEFAFCLFLEVNVILLGGF